MTKPTIAKSTNSRTAASTTHPDTFSQFPSPGKLAKALESGKWKKAKDQLGKGVRRCCLGVGAEMTLGRKLTVKEREHIMPKEVQVGHGWLDDSLDYWGLDWRKFSDTAPNRHDRVGSFLTILNDDYSGWSKVIAFLKDLQKAMNKRAREEKKERGKG